MKAGDVPWLAFNRRKTFLTNCNHARLSREMFSMPIWLYLKLRCFTEVPVSESEGELQRSVQLQEFWDLLTSTNFKTSIKVGPTLTYITLPTDGSIVSFVDSAKNQAIHLGLRIFCCAGTWFSLVAFLPDASNGKFLHPVVLAIEALKDINLMVVS